MENKIIENKKKRKKWKITICGNLAIFRKHLIFNELNNTHTNNGEKWVNIWIFYFNEAIK